MGKTVQTPEFIHNMLAQYDGVRLLGGIGERSRAVAELCRKMGAAGALVNTVRMFGQKNESPGVRFRVGHPALIIATPGLEELSERDRATVRQASLLERVLTQPFFRAEATRGNSTGSVR
jgi:F0F1-type ATP synthase beta subunit